MIEVIEASIEDYPVIQNMARFYLYDMTGYCASISPDWNIPRDGLYECFDFQNYFTDSTRKAFFIKSQQVIAGFVLLDKECKYPDSTWNMGEFFILKQFQNQGIAEKVAVKIWDMFPGIWEVSVIPQNSKALAFWCDTVSYFTEGVYEEELKKIDYDKDQPYRYILKFDTKSHRIKQTYSVQKATYHDIAEMVELSRQKRLDYEKAHPQFWKHAKDAENIQRDWFNILLEKKDYISLTAKEGDKMQGFVIGKIVSCPEVYDAGLTLMVDDFCVSAGKMWNTVGKALLDELKTYGSKEGVKQFLVVCGKHDSHKSRFLKRYNLEVASEWYVGRM